MRRFAAAFAALLLAVAGPAAAQGDSLTIREFRADVVIHPDGVADVTETLRIAFYGSWNGINRDLLLRHETAEGRRERLRVRFSAPTDGQGRELRHEFERPDGWTRRVKAWVPGAHDAERTVVIRYRVENAIRFFEEGSAAGALDEFYWNVTGNQWTMPIDRVVASITLPAGATPMQSAVYTGWSGSPERDADVQAAGSTVTFTSRGRLHPGQGLTAAVGWAPGVVARPSAAQRRARAAALRWPFLLPLLALFLAHRAWRRRGRDPRPTRRWWGTNLRPGSARRSWGPCWTTGWT